MPSAYQPILLAEDYEPDAAWLQLALKKAGVLNPIIVVEDGDEAMAYLQGTGIYADRQTFPLPAILMLDLKMPKKGGLEVLEWCQGQPQLKGILVIVLSGQHEAHQVNRAYQLGAHSFLIKPCQQQDILHLMQAYVRPWAKPDLGQSN